MEYNRRRIDKNDELNLLTGLIVSPEFVKQVLPNYQSNYLTLPYTRTVAEWAIQYYNKYEKAIGSDIMAVFDTEKSKIRDQAVVESIETFLLNLNDKYEQSESYNVQYQIDNAIKFFKSQALDLLMDKIKVAKMTGNIEQAEAEVLNFKKVSSELTTVIDVWEDKEACIRAIRGEGNEDKLFSMPGGVDKYIRPFKRQDFVAILAPSGRGKTWLLNELALTASLAKLNVVYYSFEMTESQILSRFLQRITGQLEANNDEYNQEETISIPYFDSAYESNGRINQKKEVRYRLGTRRALQQVNNIKRLVHGKSFKLICEPAGSMSIADINTSLDNLEAIDGFTADVICVDYADLIKPGSGRERRFQLDEIWMGLRAISQSRNCCLITVSHTNKGTFDRDIKQGDYSEASSKSNHLTLSIALNQDEKDRENNAVRLSVMKDRFARFNPAMEIMVLQALDVGQVFLDSRKVKKEEKG